MPTPVSDFISRTALGPRQAHKALTLWPLLLRPDAPAASGEPYRALAPALEDGAVAIDELGGGGSVPNVRVSNRGETGVLFLFGESIVGEKQNRVANASFLVPGGSDVVIDVSCVEAGRWGRRSGGSGFRHSDEVLSHSLRRRMHLRVSAARREGRRFDADQGEVWQSVSERLSHSHTASRSSAYADYSDSRRTDMTEMGKAFRPVERQVGFVASIGDEVVGAELIGRPEVFRDDFDALFRSYAIDAIDSGLVRELEKDRTDDGGAAARFDAPEPFLDALSAAHCEHGPTLGAGEDLRLSERGVSGCALAGADLIHLSAFPA